MRIKDILIRQKNNVNIAIAEVNRSITYKELYTLSNYYSKIAKISKSQNVGLLINNSINYAICYFAIALADKTIVPIYHNESVDKVKEIVEFCDIDLVFTDVFNMSLLQKSLYNIKNVVKIYNISNEITETYGIAIKPDINKYTHKDVAILLGTSGSTGKPNKVMLTHDNLISNIRACIKSLELTASDRTLIVLPMLFGYCNTSQFLSHLYLGAQVYILELPFIFQEFINAVNKFQITNTTLVPFLMHIINEQKNEYYMPTLKYLCFGGSPISDEALENLYKKFPNVGFVHTYGQTEAGPRVTALLPKYAKEFIGSVGTAIPGVEILIDSNMSENKGEILVKSKSVMKGYYKNKDLTEKTIINGYLHTGDIGYIKNNMLYIFGRIKSIIIVEGVNVSPERVEKVLTSIDIIKEALVYGEADKVTGQKVVADIVLLDSKNYCENNVLDYCKNKLNKFELPKKINIVNRIDKTKTGKIKRIKE